MGVWRGGGCVVLLSEKQLVAAAWLAWLPKNQTTLDRFRPL